MNNSLQEHRTIIGNVICNLSRIGGENIKVGAALISRNYFFIAESNSFLEFALFLLKELSMKVDKQLFLKFVLTLVIVSMNFEFCMSLSISVVLVQSPCEGQIFDQVKYPDKWTGVKYSLAKSRNGPNKSSDSSE